MIENNPFFPKIKLEGKHAISTLSDGSTKAVLLAENTPVVIYRGGEDQSVETINNQTRALLKKLS